MSILRAKSAAKYKKRYNDYVQFCTDKKLQVETGIYPYIVTLSKLYKPTTLQSCMSMIKKTLLDNHNIKLNTEKAQAFLNVHHSNHKKKKASVFTRKEISEYLKKTGFEGTDLMIKVAIYIALYGALRISELTMLMVEDIILSDREIQVRIRQSKTDTTQEGFYFVIPQQMGNKNCPFLLIKKYLSNLPDLSGRLFRYANSKTKKFTKRVIGKNSMATIPFKIATKLGLNSPKSYTGHALRRTATTWLADSGATTLDLMRFGR